MTASVRDDQDGVKWAAAQAALAPLAPGDYIVELSTNAAGAPDSPRKTLVAFRVIP